LIDIVCEEEHFLKMLELVLDHNIKLIERLLKLDPDGIFLADDWGTQLALLISPDLWKKHFYPAYKRMIDLILNAGKHVFFHSDGNVTAILPDLVNLGVNVFWIEYYVNKIDWVVANFGGKVAFLSLADTQTIELGTPQDIEKQTKEEISLLGRFNGGLIACIYLEHNERYKALTKAFVEYRNY
jgi:uroporphyrinogen-III decarboxylase